LDLLLHGLGGSSTNKTDRHDITEILLKVALNTISQTKSIYHLEYNAPHYNNMDICSNHKIQNQYANKEMNILDTFINRILPQSTHISLFKNEFDRMHMHPCVDSTIQ
jgi:hypothetical protein